MNAVWKYELLIDDEVVVEMPEGAEIVHVGVQNPVNISMVTVWARCRVEPAARLGRRLFLIRGTGHPVGDEPHLGSVITAGGALVWHIFDGGWAE